MLYFAYGSNMDRSGMAGRCPGARPLGPARLDGFAFRITADGYASVAPRAGAAVHGVLWRLTPRDLAALNIFESLDSGLYGRAMLPVRRGGQRLRALVYVGRRSAGGGMSAERRPKPGYMATLTAAAIDWGLPPSYVGALRRRAPSRLAGARARETGEI